MKILSGPPSHSTGLQSDLLWPALTTQATHPRCQAASLPPPPHERASEHATGKTDGCPSLPRPPHLPRCRAEWLRERGTKKVHVFMGERVQVDKPKGAPAWLPDKLWKPQVKKIGTEKLEKL